ncbi:MAG: hypothetical protein DID89_2727547431 [Candidatus Nitrotoga sp. CP45]|nr:MAG: hypothetical protein DID89_2727547431 [Candidatus Nitrotoga sp. CP45]
MTHGANASTPDDVFLFAILDLRDGMVFAKDALGHRENVTIGGINGVLEMPSLPNREGAFDGSLVPPEAARTWECGNNPLFWGQEVVYPDGIARLQAALIKFRVPASKLRDHSTSVSKSLGNWYSTFVDFHDLFTKNSVRRGARVSSSDSVEHELFILDANSQKVQPHGSETIYFSSPIISGRDALDRANFIEICRLCSFGSRPVLHYRIQLQAYRALRDQDYRKAMIESAIAAEIVLTEAIVKYTGYSYGDKIMKDHQTLGRRLKLAKKVGLSLPDGDFFKMVAEPRNQAIHEAKSFERSDALSVVMAVDQLLQMLSPRRDEQI